MLIYCYQFPIAVRNYHKLSSLKKHKFILQLQRAEIQNGSHWDKLKVLSREENLLFLTFPAYWRLPTFFGSLPFTTLASASITLSFSLTLTFLPSFYKDHCYYSPME